MAKELRFDVTALDQASKTFARMATAVEAFERRLDKLDGKKVRAEVEVKTDEAEREIGRFATEMRRKVQAAVDSLPDIELDADSSDADRALVDIRRRMQELADKTIGVDLSAEEAIAEAQQLKLALDELGRTTADPRVRADTASASAELAKVSGEVDNLDRKTATVKVKADKSVKDSTIDIALLGRSLASLSIPAAVVAGAPAILALGQAAVTASGSLYLVPAAAGAAGLAVGTLKVAFSGFGDAIGDDPKKAAEAMADMAPAARAAATAVQGLRPAWDGLRLEVQQQMFAGLGEQITKVGGTYLPILRDAMSRVGESFGRGATQASMFLQSSLAVSSVTSMFSDMENTVENLVSSTMGPLTSAFVDLGTVGAGVLADLTTGAGNAAQRFAQFVRNARDTGQLEGWMRRGVDTLRELGQVTVNVGASLGSMMRAAGVASGDFLGNLVDVTGRMREFLSSAQGQARMIGMFEGINRAVVALAPGVQAAGQAIAQMLQHATSTGSLETLAGALSNLIVAAAPVVVAFSNLTSAGLRPVAAALGFLAPVIGPVIAGFVMMRAVSSALSFAAAITGVKTMAAGLVGLRTSLTATSAVAATAGASARNAGAGMRAAAAGATVAGTAAATAGSKVGASSGRFAQARASASSLGAALPLVGLAFAGTAAYVTATTVSLGDAVAAMNEGGAAADAMRRKVEEQTLGLGENAAGFDFGFSAVSNWARGNILGVATVDTMNKALEEQKRQQEAAGAAAANAAGITKQAYDDITGSQKRAAEASKQVTDNLALIGPAMSGIKDGVIPTQEMQTALDATGNSARTAATEAGLAAQRLGGVGAGADAAAASMQASRDAFIATATGAGMTADEAAKLADRLGLVPATVRTEFQTNAAAIATDISQIAAKVREVPPGKTITVTSMTDSAKQQLQEIGFTVKTLPDGRVEVTANTEAAKGQLALLESAARNPVNKNIDLNTLDAHTKARVLNDEASKPENKQVNVDLGASLPAVQGLGAEARKPEQKPVDANVTGGLSAVELLQGSAQQGATKTVVADVSVGAASVAGLQGQATAGATKPVVANTGAAVGAVATLQGQAQAGATKPVAANTGAATGAVASLQSSASAPATKPVNASTGAAASAINALRAIASNPVTMFVNVVKRAFGAEGGIFAPMASGGIVAPAPRIVPFADGGVADPMTYQGHRLTPMNAKQPRIVGPNTWRVIGDRADRPEAFIPLVRGSATSQALWEASGNALGRQAVPAGMKLVAAETGPQIVPMAEGGMVTAARLILDRMNARAPLSEDWTWRGAPAVVGQYNDALHNARERAGFSYARGREWLQQYVRQATAARPTVPTPAAMRAQVQAAAAQRTAATAPQVSVAGLNEARAMLGELRAHTALLTGLRADALSSASHVPQFAEQLRGFIDRLARTTSATERSALGRDLGSQGAWPT